MRTIFMAAVCALGLMVLSAVPRAHAADGAEPLIRLPLTFHAIRKLEVTIGGAAMTTWISPDEIQNVVMPEVNRIWRPAGIEWVLVAIDLVDYSTRDDKLTQLLASITRDDALAWGDSPVDQALRRMEQSVRPDLNSFHLFVLPYIAKNIWGLASSTRAVAHLASWVEPAAPGRPARKIPLLGGETQRHGSFAHTTAHELGHLLGLKHDSCPTECLMVAGGVGTRLSEDDIRRTRERAALIARRLPKKI